MEEKTFFNDSNHKKILHYYNYENYFTVYHFDFNIEIIWNIFKDVFKTNSINYTITSETELIKGYNSYSIGSEFSFFYFKIVKIFFSVLKVIDLPNYKKLVWKAYKSEPIDVKYFYIYELYFDSINNITKLKWEIIYGKNYEFYFGKNLDYKKVKLASDMNDLLNLIHNNIKLKYPHCVNHESIIIKKNFDEIFSTILNIKKMCEIIPEMADKVEFDGYLLKENSSFKLYIKQKIFYMKVNKMTEDDRERVLEYECFTGNNDLTPNQVIEWRVILLSINHCMVSIKHIFKDKLTSKNLEFFSERKHLILKKLKNYFEKKVKFNNSLDCDNASNQ